MNLMLAFLSFAKPLKMSSPINKELKAALRWLTTVFPRLGSTRYDTLPHISICCACKNDASNLKK